MSDLKALFKIGYGLYVVTSFDGEKHNGLIVNTVVQLTSTPAKVAVTINKENYSHDVIKNTKKLNVNCLTTEAPFSVFETFGFSSGKTTDKFRYTPFSKSKNGLAVLTSNINAVISLTVDQYLDVGTHGLFICSVEDAEILSNVDSMTYAYYHKNVKPKPVKAEKKGYVCKICGYFHDSEELPNDFICPICKHGAIDFEPIN